MDPANKSETAPPEAATDTQGFVRQRLDALSDAWQHLKGPEMVRAVAITPVFIGASVLRAQLLVETHIDGRYDAALAAHNNSERYTFDHKTRSWHETDKHNPAIVQARRSSRAFRWFQAADRYLREQ